MHHDALHLMHCTIYLLAHICSCTLGHVEPEFEESTVQAQVEAITNLALDHVMPQRINQCSLYFTLFQILLDVPLWLCIKFIGVVWYRSCIRIDVTPSFKAKARCSSYVCPESSFHTYGQNYNISNKNQCHYNSINSILSHYNQDLNMTLAETRQHSTGSWEVGTPARRTHHQGTPHRLQHLPNIIVSMESKASVSTLMVGTLQVLGTNDM
jgi:hypothetical protein